MYTVCSVVGGRDVGIFAFFVHKWMFCGQVSYFSTEESCYNIPCLMFFLFSDNIENGIGCRGTGHEMVK